MDQVYLSVSVGGCPETDGTTRQVLGFCGGDAAGAECTDSEKGWRALPTWWGDIWVPRRGGRFLHIQLAVIPAGGRKVVSEAS